jgi:hypothetical protein
VFSSFSFWLVLILIVDAEGGMKPVDQVVDRFIDLIGGEEGEVGWVSECFLLIFPHLTNTHTSRIVTNSLAVHVQFARNKQDEMLVYPLHLHLPQQHSPVKYGVLIRQSSRCCLSPNSNSNSTRQKTRTGCYLHLHRSRHQFYKHPGMVTCWMKPGECLRLRLGM